MRLYTKGAILLVVLSLFVVAGLNAETVKSYTFDKSFEGWVPMEVSHIDPNIEPAFFNAVNGQLSIDANGVVTDPDKRTYGLWISDPADFSAADIPADSLFRATYYVSTDQPDHTRVPMLRLGMTNETSNIISLSHYASVANNTVINMPTAVLQPYETYFQPHEGSLWPSFDGLAATFELLNGETGSDDGALYMDRVVIDRFDISSAIFTNTQSFDMTNWSPNYDLNNDHGFYTCDFLTSAGGGIGLSPFDSGSVEQSENCLGEWVSFPQSLSVDGTTPGGDTYLYRGKYNISTTTADQGNVPMAFVALVQSAGREMSALGITSNIPGIDTPPTPAGKDYSLFFKPLQVEIQTAPSYERRVYSVFQLRNFYGDDPDSEVYVNSVSLDRIDASTLVP